MNYSDSVDKRLYSETMSHTGISIGIVKSINDPLNIGRVKLFIPSYHHKDVTLDEMPFAIPMTFGFSGKNFGFRDVPPVGTHVFVMFIDGNINVPVYMGSYYINSEVMTEVQDEEGDIHDKVVYKTKKGVTILIDNADKSERISIIDRAGQSVEMYSPMKEDTVDRDVDGDNKLAGTQNTFKLDDTVNNQAYIKVTDLAGQQILMTADKDAEKIQLLGMGDDNNKMQLSLDSTKDNKKVTVKATEEQFIEIDVKEESLIAKIKDNTVEMTKTHIKATDVSGQQLIMDAANEGAEKIQLLGKGTGSNKMELIVDSTEDAEKIQLLGKGQGNTRTRITLDNTNGSEKISMWASSDQYIELDVANESLIAKVKKGLFEISKDGDIGLTYANKSKIHIDSGGNGEFSGEGDMTIKFKSLSMHDNSGKGIDISNGTMNVDVTSFKVDAAADAAISSGASLNLESSGVAEIAGSLLKLNKGSMPVAYVGGKSVGSPGSTVIMEGKPTILV